MKAIPIFKPYLKESGIFESYFEAYSAVLVGHVENMVVRTDHIQPLVLRHMEKKDTAERRTHMAAEPA